MFKVVEASALDELSRMAVDVCTVHDVRNLILNVECDYAEIDSLFVRTHTPDAIEWQAPVVPRQKYFTHGYYMDRGPKRGRQFIIDELKRKSDSRRACVSLISMADIADSGDLPIPSFLVAQFALSNDGETIHTTAYYRALEVSRFLPINLAELCDILREIRGHFPALERFGLTIIAFHAYSDPMFSCLTKAALDMASPMEVLVAVQDKNHEKLNEWIESKLYPSDSVVCLDGLQHLLEALDLAGGQYPSAFRRGVEGALKASVKMRALRLVSSNSSRLPGLQEQVRNSLTRAQQALR